MFSEWKNFLKMDSQGYRARDEADLEERINAFELVLAHATVYCHYIVTTV